jgi:hypothetical protein
MVDVSYSAFFDELSKIAEAKPEDDKGYVTKEKLKRLGIVAGVAGLGGAAGAGGAYLVRKQFRKYRPEIKGFLHKHPKLRYLIPGAAGALAAGAGAAAALKSRKVKQYLEKKKDDQGSGPK